MDMQDTAGEARTNSSVMYSYGTPAYGQAKAGRPARTNIQQLCEDTGCNPEDLPKAMNDREKWRERVRDIRASGTIWWWWWWWWVPSSLQKNFLKCVIIIISSVVRNCIRIYVGFINNLHSSIRAKLNGICVIISILPVFPNIMNIPVVFIITLYYSVFIIT